MKHFILENSHQYSETHPDLFLNNARYDEESGYWRSIYTGEAILIEDGFVHINTKKADCETGEDQKGE